MTTDNYLGTNHFEIISSGDINRIRLFLLEKYQFDVHQYAATFINRRFVYMMLKHKISNVDELLKRFSDPEFFEQFLSELSVKGTEFFRDTSMWENLLKAMIEHFSSVKDIRIWFPNCGNGEEL